LKLEEEHGALERELQELLAQRAAEEPAIQQLTEECTKLENEINVLNKRQAILRHETGELKAKNNELRDEVVSINTLFRYKLQHKTHDPFYLSFF
jgi:hypothetical protein